MHSVSAAMYIFLYKVAATFTLIVFVYSGKYPHLLVSLTGRPASSLSHQNLEAVVHFGAIPVGSTATKWVELHNLSPVSHNKKTAIVKK